MNLGIFLTSGDSLENIKKSGQETLFKNYYLKEFSKTFSKIYIFSYKKENPKWLPKNVIIVPNKFSINRFLYSCLMGLINYKHVRDCDVIRAYHLFGVTPAIIARILFLKPFIFNFAYDYEKVARIENKTIQFFLLKLIRPLAILLATQIFIANKQLLRTISSNKFVYLPNGTDTNLFKPHKVKKRIKTFSILSVGRLEKQKNFESLIKAVSNKNIRITIIGKGSLKNRLSQLAQTNNVNLEIIPFVRNKDMPKIYTQADIFVLPSLIEGSPKVLLEAMSCGLPVIASNVEGNKEIVNSSNGLKCQTTSASIKKAIFYLARNPRLREKLGKSARSYIIKNFSLGTLLKIEIESLQKLK